VIVDAQNLDAGNGCGSCRHHEFMLRQTRPSRKPSIKNCCDSFEARRVPRGGRIQLVRSRTSIRRQPKRRASTDHAPGPSSPRAAPIAASRNEGPVTISGNDGVARPAKIAQRLGKARRNPATGVHKPGNNSAPAAMFSTPGMAVPIASPPLNACSPLAIAAAPPAIRSRSRPAPGAPRAKVEKSRRTNYQRL
jgi:hypothetical protein